MRAKGLTQQEIAATAGVSHQTVGRDLANVQTDIEQPASIRTARGERPATYARSSSDVIDAELVEDEPVHVNRETGEITTPDTNAGPVPITDPAASTTTTCPTCGGTGKVTHP